MPCQFNSRSVSSSCCAFRAFRAMPVSTSQTSSLFTSRWCKGGVSEEVNFRQLPIQLFFLILFLRLSLDFFPRNSWDILRNISPEIPKKFSELCHQFIDYLGNCIRDIVSWKFLSNISPEILPKRNSWVIHRNISPAIPEKLSGLSH